MSKKVVIVGGHGKVALKLTHLIAPNHDVTSIIRDTAHAPDITAASAHPLVMSVEDDSPADFAKVFAGKDVVYYTAGSGGKGGDARTEAVDYRGAVKVFDALEAVEGPKPRLILLSSIDARDASKPPPAHYNDADVKASQGLHAAIPLYMSCKYRADKDLVQRTAFKWTILRPNFYTDEPGTGKALVGRTHLDAYIPRDDVAKALALLLNRDDATSLALDLVGGDTLLEDAMDAAISKGETGLLP
ncbi:NADH(P)-binding-domain-containing protein [Schizophyllum amplum]|uniref:NADH(P)-binding-domain-containing protein n=1 Tax=Schizophyllum amplum TaxID=97359 RepID=A0A550CRN2_9AGAR|nr:NADH(P)-binding-domain-containing protein [Auriculariopsis ampla]